MITGDDIIRIVQSPNFQEDLAELSAYAASMKQERPIALLFSKYFWRNGHKAAPELKKCDLDVDGTRVEIKFHYDSDVRDARAEMERHGVTIKTLADRIEDRTLHPTWAATPGIYKDITQKEADVFIWIICSRDLSGLTEKDRERICWNHYHEKFRKQYPYSDSSETFALAEDFISSLTTARPCSIQRSTVSTTRMFSSDRMLSSLYHFIICDFGSC